MNPDEAKKLLAKKAMYRAYNRETGQFVVLGKKHTWKQLKSAYEFLLNKVTLRKNLGGWNYHKLTEEERELEMKKWELHVYPEDSGIPVPFEVLQNEMEERQLEKENKQKEIQRRRAIKNAEDELLELEFKLLEAQERVNRLKSTK